MSMRETNDYKSGWQERAGINAEAYPESYTFSSGIQMNIMDWHVQEKQPGIYKSATPMAEFHYCLAGAIDANLNGQELRVCQNQMLLSYMPHIEMETEYQPGQTLKCISIAFTEHSYDQLIASRFPEHKLSFRQMLGSGLYNHRERPLDSHIKILLRQLLHCPYHQSLKSFYMESKTLELIAASTEEMLLSEREGQKKSKIHGDELLKLRHAREVIVNRMDNPPSLLELARIVGLNDNKLKYGFKEIYGMSVFSYLRERRLEKALDLLRSGQANVSETAWKIGYTNLSHFAEVFRDRYGINPGEVRRESCRGS